MFIKANQPHIQINMQHDDIIFLIVACFEAAKLALPILFFGILTFKLIK